MPAWQSAQKESRAASAAPSVDYAGGRMPLCTRVHSIAAGSSMINPSDMDTLSTHQVLGLHIGRKGEREKLEYLNNLGGIAARWLQYNILLYFNETLSHAPFCLMTQASISCRLYSFVVALSETKRTFFSRQTRPGRMIRLCLSDSICAASWAVM